MWGHMAGQHGHSTKSELAAVLVAMIRPIPLHIATDSQALIKKAETWMRAAKLWQFGTATEHWTTKMSCGKP